MTIEEYRIKKEELLYINSNGRKMKLSDCVCPEMCKKCKNVCCKRFPCAFSPEEFLDLENTNYMLELLKTGLIILAPINKNILGIRARGIEDPSKIISNIE